MEEETYKLRVLLVDDSEDARLITRRALDLVDGFVIVGEAETAEWGRALAAKTQPDIILLDVELPGVDGFHLIPYLQSAAPDARIVMLSSSDTQVGNRRALSVGVSFISKEHPVATLATKILENLWHPVRSAPDRIVD